MSKRTPTAIPKGTFRYVIADDPKVVSGTRIRIFKISSSAVARDGHTLKTSGWITDNYEKNPVVLACHDAESLHSIVGRAVRLYVVGDDLFAEIEFAPGDLNPLAEMTLRMVDEGFLRATSVGFIPLSGKPSSRGPGSYDFDSQELLEISIVPVGSLPDALLAARRAGIDMSPIREWAKRNLEIDMDMIAATDEEGRVDEPAAPAPEEETTENQPSARKPPAISKRGLYLVAQLAYQLAELDYLTEASENETANEGDDSPVPAMLQDVLASLGAALIAMTQEEVAELLAEEPDDDSNMGSYALMMSADAETRATLVDALRDAAAGKAVSITTTRAVGRVRIGKMLSRENINTLKTAHEHMCRAVDNVAGLIQSAEADDAPPPEDSTHTEAERAAARAARERKVKALQAQISE